MKLIPTKEYDEKETRLKELERGLEESLKLQAHYASLLNMHDGGERIVFKSIQQWLERLKTTMGSI